MLLPQDEQVFLHYWGLKANPFATVLAEEENNHFLQDSHVDYVQMEEFETIFSSAHHTLVIGTVGLGKTHLARFKEMQTKPNELTLYFGPHHLDTLCEQPEYRAGLLTEQAYESYLVRLIYAQLGRSYPGGLPTRCLRLGGLLSYLNRSSLYLLIDGCEQSMAARCFGLVNLLQPLLASSYLLMSPGPKIILKIFLPPDQAATLSLDEKTFRRYTLRSWEPKILSELLQKRLELNRSGELEGVKPEYETNLQQLIGEAELLPLGRHKNLAIEASLGSPRRLLQFCQLLFRHPQDKGLTIQSRSQALIEYFLLVWTKLSREEGLRLFQPLDKLITTLQDAKDTDLAGSSEFESRAILIETLGDLINLKLKYYNC
jgi:hypothetical protein